MDYDYRDAMRDDINDAIDEIEEWEGATIDELFVTKERAFDDLYDRLWVNDSVTGNASGSYTFNTWQAEEYIAHNLDLLSEALTEFGCDSNYITEHGAEACDVTIRCYLLSEMLSEVLDERM